MNACSFRRMRRALKSIAAATTGLPEIHTEGVFIIECLDLTATEVYQEIADE